MSASKTQGEAQPRERAAYSCDHLFVMNNIRVEYAIIWYPAPARRGIIYQNLMEAIAAGIRTAEVSHHS